MRGGAARWRRNNGSAIGDGKYKLVKYAPYRVLPDDCRYLLLFFRQIDIRAQFRQAGAQIASSCALLSVTRCKYFFSGSAWPLQPQVYRHGKPLGANRKRLHHVGRCSLNIRPNASSMSFIGKLKIKLKLNTARLGRLSEG